jgi:hypothetical protein
MKWVGIAAALLAAAAALGTGLWLYRNAVERDIADIRSRLVSEAALANPDDPETLSGIRLAPIQCERVFDLRANAIAEALEGAELDALWKYCERLADLASGLDKIGRQAPP